MHELNEKVAVITGGGGILCGTIARTLGKLGVRVALLDIRKEKVEEVRRDIVEEGTVIDLVDKAGRKGNTGQWMDRCPVRTGDVAHPDTRRK